MRTLKVFIGILLLSLLSWPFVEWMPSASLLTSDVKMNWIRSKILDDQEHRVDYVMVGGSTIWGGIKPNRMNGRIGGNGWNFGRNWVGRDADYVLIKHLLEHHKVDRIVLEVIENDAAPDYLTPHGYLKYIISPSEMLLETSYWLGTLKAADVLFLTPDSKRKFGYLLEYAAQISVRLPRAFLANAFKGKEKRQQLEHTLRLNDHSRGFQVEDAELVQDKKFYEEYKNKLWPFQDNPKMPIPFPHGSRNDFYTRKIAELAHNHGAKLYFLWMPSCRVPGPSQDVFDYYESLGEIIIPRYAAINRIEYWRNMSHVFQKGADVFTDELSAYLSRPRQNPIYKIY
jgi:hypothetical protein